MSKKVPVPKITGGYSPIGSDPDLGDLTTPEQQPVDFGVWQAADGTWQLWSCIRKTKAGGEGGKTRLFYCWEGKSLTSSNWKPMGIAMQANPSLGETPGGLQAPFVIRYRGLFYMFYGDWERMCLATSRDGKRFERHVGEDGTPALFTEGHGFNTRDAMLLRHQALWYIYYTAYPNDQGVVYARTSEDLYNWSDSYAVAFGGHVGVGRYESECPFVVKRGPNDFYLFRTQHYGKAQTTVYHSDDPLMFGINQDDQFLVCQLPICAPEIVHYDGKDYLFTLRSDLKGLVRARLEWK